MADELNEVRPGDRITAELINTLIRRVKNPGGGEGTVAVPNVFGLNLGVARNSLGAAGLTVGTVLDTGGVNVDVNNSANHLRLVLNQVPEPGTFVTSGQAVSLTITAQTTGTAGVLVPDLFGKTLSAAKELATSSGLSLSEGYDPFGTQLDLNAAPIQSRLVLAQIPAAGIRVNSGMPMRLVLSAEPVADAGTLLKITSINPSAAPLRSEIQILGSNFASNSADNAVFFNGVRAVAPSAQSTTNSLYVVIPDMNIDLDHSNDGIEDGVEVFVTVETPSGHSPERAMRVLAPLRKHLPTISKTLDTVLREGDVSTRAIVVQLSNYYEWFASNPHPEDIRLYLNGLPGGGIRGPSYQPPGLVFALPQNVPELNTQPGSTVLVRLWLDGFLSPAVLHTFKA